MELATVQLETIKLEIYRSQVKAELDAIEQERKRLRGKQRDLHFRAAIVAGKFQLLKQMEADVNQVEVDVNKTDVNPPDVTEAECNRSR